MTRATPANCGWWWSIALENLTSVLTMLSAEPRVRAEFTDLAKGVGNPCNHRTEVMFLRNHRYRGHKVGEAGFNAFDIARLMGR